MNFGVASNFQTLFYFFRIDVRKLLMNMHLMVPFMGVKVKVTREGIFEDC
jgi:hypothetical protein